MTASVLKFKHVGPLEDVVLQGHIAHAVGLGLPSALPYVRRLNIVANGPSARGMDLRFPAHEDIMALNGALGLMRAQGLLPDLWAACDPQALVADFLGDDPSPYVRYLLATKCHPDVFARLRERNVRLWHCGDTPAPVGFTAVRQGSSITLTALHLARLMGYRDLHVWGWDCCVLDGAHHAHASAPPPDLVTLDIRTSLDAPAGVPFLTTYTWAAETEQALGHIAELAQWGVTVTVHGPGMVAAALDFTRSLEAPDGP